MEREQKLGYTQWCAYVKEQMAKAKDKFKMRDTLVALVMDAVEAGTLPKMEAMHWVQPTSDAILAWIDEGETDI